MPESTPIFAILCMFIGLPLILLSIPFTLIWTHHRRKMTELRLQREIVVNQQVQAQLDAVRAEIQALRDTATQYDMSFDSSLERMERRGLWKCAKLAVFTTGRLGVDSLFFSLPLADSEWIGALVVFLIFGGGGAVVKIFETMARSRVEIAQLRAGQQTSVQNSSELIALREEVRTLRDELSSLRDTATQYDMSFDSALQRIDRRVEQVEQTQRQQIGM
ncbi:MAG: hypothetical protein NT023_11575 [Armatimonadetes bacterium]|nr:hypothetical protein [Armatimonadota bacterium]